MKSKKREIIALRELIAIAKEVGSGKETIKRAVKIFRATLRAGDGVRHVMMGRSYTVFEISSIYIAARGTSDEWPMQSYVDAALKLTEMKQSISLREMNKAVIAQKTLLHITLTPPTKAEEYVPIIVARAGLSDLTRDKALELIKLHGSISTIGKRHSRAVAAGMIYSAVALYHTDEITQPRLAVLSGISITTIRLVFSTVRRRGMKKKVAFVVRRGNIA
jgi:transcription initiation factor TFIIIB Brf1 subunit/transcription initiation factor TFIIB